MAKTLSNAGISTTSTIEAGHVTQSIDAFTGTEAYDITVSGSLSVTGPTTLTGATTGTFSGSFSGSFDGSVTSASYAAIATSASYAATATSASYALTASFLEGSVTSASYASTASYVLASNIDQPFTDITASGNISASGNIYGNLYQLKNQTLATYAGNVLRLTDGAWDYIDINNTTVTIGGGTGDLQLQNITASSDISASGDVNAANLYTVGKVQAEASVITPLISSATSVVTISDNLNVVGQITASGNVSSSGNIYGVTGSFSNISASGTIIANKIESANLVSHLGDANTGIAFGSDTVVIESNDSNVAVFQNYTQTIGNNAPSPPGTFTEVNIVGTSLNVSSNITASGNISSSGTVYGVTGSFSHLVGNSPITVSSPIISQLNNTKVVEVENSSSFPTPVGTQITLEENTTYVVRGNVNMSDTLFASGSGISLIGLDRNLDTLTYTSSSTFLTVENSDFTIRDLKFSATNTGSLLISGSNYTSGSFNQGRNKVFEVINSQFRNCGNVADFNGYDLIDFSNTLFFYVQAPTIGVRFKDTSKTEISSCEFIRWYDETSNPSPSGYSTAPMIEFADTGSEGVGFGAVNINGCIIHPQVTQDGIRIATGSTTSFGTISSNTFINLNLTTGSVFYPTNVQDLPDYSLSSTVGYDVLANQGLEDSQAYLYGYQVGTDSQDASETYTQVTIANFQTNISSRMSASLEGVVYIGTKPITVQVTVNAGLNGVGGNGEEFDIALYKNSALISGSERELSLDTDEIGNVQCFSLANIVENDLITVYQKSPTNDNFTLENFTIMIKQ